MKSFDDLNKNIDKYYEGSLDGATSDEFELKSILDKMSIANDMENNIPVSIDISSIVEKGQEIGFNIKLRKATIKFLLVATLMSIFIGFMCTKVSIAAIVEVQFVLLILLLIINSFIIRRKARGEG